MKKSELTHEMVREFFDYGKLTGILTTGVYKTKCGHFIVIIKNKSIGTYKTISEAARVRKNAERRYGFSEGHGSSKVPQ